MKKFFLYMLPVVLLAACNTEPRTNTTVEAEGDIPQATENQSLRVSTGEGEALTFENLSVYPIVADEDFYKTNTAAETMKNLKEGIETKGFYITEKKPYGRMEDSDAVNSLTVQNKSNETVYLMQGDVIQGGNQDRILAEDRVIAARTITDIPVYCVEHGRWQYKAEGDQEDAEAKHKRKIFAFSGYYNVASSDLRKTVRETQDQQSVWNKVGELTAKNNAKSSTETYTALEGSDEFTDKRDAYLTFMNEKLAGVENCVGFVAVSGNKIIGTDVFGHPNLFKKQSAALLHGYVTDAISNGQKVIVSDKRMERFGKELNKKYESAIKGGNTDEMYKHNGEFIHFSEL